MEEGKKECRQGGSRKKGRKLGRKEGRKKGRKERRKARWKEERNRAKKLIK